MIQKIKIRPEKWPLLFGNFGQINLAEGKWSLVIHPHIKDAMEGHGFHSYSFNSDEQGQYVLLAFLRDEPFDEVLFRLAFF